MPFALLYTVAISWATHGSNLVLGHTCSQRTVTLLARSTLPIRRTVADYQFKSTVVAEPVTFQGAIAQALTTPSTSNEYLKVWKPLDIAFRGH
jgi:hypothetical protein